MQSKGWCGRYVFRNNLQISQQTGGATKWKTNQLCSIESSSIDRVFIQLISIDNSQTKQDFQLFERASYFQISLSKIQNKPAKNHLPPLHEALTPTPHKWSLHC